MNTKLNDKSNTNHNHSNSYLELSGGTINGPVKVVNALGVNPNLFDNSYITILSKTNEISSCRASIGFHNRGYNGAAIYLDLDGSIRVVWNDGVSKPIVTR